MASETGSSKLGNLVTSFYQARGASFDDRLPLIALPNLPEHAAYNELLVGQVPTGYVVARANTEGRITEMVRRGIGIGLIDNFVGEADPELERLPGLGGLENMLWAVTHVEMRRAARVRIVLDFLSDLVTHARMA